MARLLVVDDEQSILEFFEILLEREGYEVEVVSHGKEAIEKVSQEPFDLVITDLSMPEVDGMMVLEKVKEISPETVVLMVTAFATAESAVEAMKKGAYDYLMKPFKVDEIRLVIRNALEKAHLRRENVNLKKQVHREKGFANLIGSSRSMREVFDIIGRVASGKASVLIVGESGTGKELVAKAIHENSPRSEKPFVTINCAAIPENLIESELFGYVRGAFTGAHANKMGLFEAAHGGTLFLDEIGELPPQVQVKLLRVLQERSVRRIGSTTSSPVDVRILSATNRDLEEAIEQGIFREDLFYRLNVIQLGLPALRERKEDIPLLARFFLERYAKEHEKDLEGISPEAMDLIQNYDFPGNVRELENVIEQCVTFETTSMISSQTLPEKVRLAAKTMVSQTALFPKQGVDLERQMDEMEKKLLLEALREANGVKKKAAALLKISFRSLRYRLMKHKIDSDEGSEG